MKEPTACGRCRIEKVFYPNIFLLKVINGHVQWIDFHEIRVAKSILIRNKLKILNINAP